MRINVSGARPEHIINGLDVDVAAGAEELRRVIAGRIGASPDRVRLIHMGRLIDGSRPLSSILEEDSTVHVAVTQGPPPPPPEDPGDSNSNSDQGGSTPVLNLFEFVNSLRGVADPLPGVIQRLLATGSGGMPQMVGPVIFQGEFLGGGINGGSSTSSLDLSNSNPQQQQQQQQQESSSATAGQEQQAQQQRRQQHQAQANPRPQTQTQTQPQQRLSFAYAMPPPEAHNFIPLQVHVHVSLDELEQLPERIERFRSRMQPSGSNTSIHIERGSLPLRGGGRATTPPATTSRTAQATNNRQGTRTNDAAASTGSAGNPAANSTLPTIGDIANAFFGASGDRGGDGDGGEASGLAQLSEIIFGDASPTVLFQLLGGDWSFVASSRQQLVNAVRRWGEEESAEGEQNTQEENRRRYIEREAVREIEALQADSAFMQAVERMRRTECNLLAELRRYIVFANEEMVNAILDPTPDSNAWTRGFRAALVRATGIALERSPVWFARGAEGFYEFLVEVIRVMMPRVGNGPADILSRSIPMIRNLMPTLIPAWHREYMSQHRRDSDVFIFDGAAATATATATMPEKTEESDDLLDDCLNEFCTGEDEDNNEPGASANHANTNAEEIRDALRNFGGVPEDQEEEIYRHAQRFRLEEPPSNNNENNSSQMWKQISKR